MPTPPRPGPPGARPRGLALRPAGGAAVGGGALVFWVGPRLVPWLERPLTVLAAGARVVRLADTPGLTRLAFREGTVFEAHDPESEPAAEPTPKSDHGEDETDPHLWLDPMNAKLWLGAIAAALAEADPARRALYLANAEAARAELDTLAAEIDARLGPVRGRPFVVFHYSFHHFARRFGTHAAGAVALADAPAPRPARTPPLRAHLPAPRAVRPSRAGVRIGVLDPLGSNLRPGPDLYPDLLRGLAESLADCLG